ncbi:MAG: ATPase P [Bacillota bacterium]|nr:ATPase P [Bacillota bacterium]
MSPVPLVIEIPGRSPVRIEHVVFDFNGTLAAHGELVTGVRERLAVLGERCRVHVVTSDTYGTAARQLDSLPLELEVLESGEAAGAKRRFLASLGADRCAAVGNGRNDQAMLEAAELAVAVMGPEGLYPPLLQVVDLVVASPLHAIDLFLDPKRFAASLRP